MEKESFFWSLSSEAIFKQFGTSIKGLSEVEAALRKDTIDVKKKSPFIRDFMLFFSQFKNPLVLLLVFGLLVSSFLGELSNSIIIFCILLLSGILGFIQERNAGKAVEKLRTLTQTKAHVKRDNKISDVSINDVVPGDIVLLKAGDIVPADSLLIESKDLYVNEGILTGESFPAEKEPGILSEDTPLLERKNSVFKGTNVTSGTATIVAVEVGKKTELGKIETEMGAISEETAFEKGIKHFGNMLIRIALILAGIILIVNISMGKPALDSILFALAISLGLAPELLPVIVTITLSAGAKRLAEKKVIVKKLAAIQNLGSIDILCSDKTGTLTEGEVKVHSYISADGLPNELINKYAYLNAIFETGYTNPMDEAIRKQGKTDITGYEKFDEVPFDFIRKRLSIVVAHNNKHIMITKGALKNITEVCNQAELSDGTLSTFNNYEKKIQEEFERFSADGYRTIGICYKDVTGDPLINKDDEQQMIFLGFITLYDPPKLNIAEIINELKQKNVRLKIITGDNTLIAKNIAKQIGIPFERIISGKEIHNLTEDKLSRKVNNIDIFSETEPSQKERIVRALQKKGHVVGYLGDGINDASALKAADVGISVNNAIDAAKEAADIILLEKELTVISEGISEGRKTYMNTLKYIFITISANFGNMLSMAGASIFLPFLPLLPAQILLINFLTDLPALAIASDNVDKEMLVKPHKWNIKLIKTFMIVFGFESSLFDFIAFGTLILIFHASPEMFRTGWFVESVISEVLILLVIRTRRTFFISPPGKYLMISAGFIFLVTMLLPFIPASSSLGFTTMPFIVVSTMLLIALIYASAGEFTKRILFKKMNY